MAVPSRCSPKTSAAATSSNPSGKYLASAISRSLSYIAAPSVATVRIDVVRPEVVVLRRLDRAEHVADAREAERRQPVENAVRHAASTQIATPAVGPEQDSETIGRPIGDRQGDVRVHDVVDQRDVLVADALDVVLAEAVVEQRWALERLTGDDERAEPLLQVVAGRDRPGRARRRDECAELEAGLPLAERLEHPLEGRARRKVVDEVVPELGELIEDDVVRICRELLARVVDLLDVALGARRSHDVAGVDHPPGEPVEALAAHALREHGDATTPQEPRNRDAPATVVARGGPHGALPGGIELPADESRDQAAIGGEDLVRPNEWKAVPECHDDRWRRRPSARGEARRGQGRRPAPRGSRRCTSAPERGSVDEPRPARLPTTPDGPCAGSGPGSQAGRTSEARRGRREADRSFAGGLERRPAGRLCPVAR